MNIGFISLGCCKNLVDSEKIMALLISGGCKIVTNPNDAEVLFVNTCGFIDSAKEEAINTILEMAEYKEKNCKKLIVLGCLAKRYKEQLQKELPEVDLFIGVDEYANLTKIFTDELGLNFDAACSNTDRLLSTKPWMAYLKIADGCDNRCSFCAIPLIRGGYVSYPIEELVKEASELAEKGVKELVVIAQDTTRYGLDLYGERRLGDLLKALSLIDGIYWIRVLYTYPDELSDSLIIEMKDLPKVLPYFDIPVQHGDNKMLALMNRRGTVEEFTNTIDKIKEVYDDPIFRTTMIVGFPGETEEMFNNLLESVKEIKWDRLGAFTYSKEEDTTAYDMDGSVDESIKEERYARLMELQKSIVEEENKKHLGKIYEVLVEKQDGFSGRYYGRSKHCAPDGIDGSVIFTSNDSIECGTFVKVKITKTKNHDMYGEHI